MASDLNKPSKKKKHKTKLSRRLMVPMLLVVLLQVIIFYAVLYVGGEFSYVRQYAYNTLIEKTENRRNYIEDELQQKVPYVQESTEKINSLVEDILAEQGASISDLQINKDLNRRIMESSVDTMVSLLRRSVVNDAYLILETGDLYTDNSGHDAKVALYLRDLDTKTDAGYEDLLMEVGFTSISKDFGIILDSGWSLHFIPDPDNNNYDFYYRTLKTAQENNNYTPESLGYWNGLSKLSSGATASMKYTMPLIAKDGSVYGVLGIGLTEKTILSGLPSNDFMSETACYVLGNDKTDDVFNIVTHSGNAFSQLVGDAKNLPISDELDEDICDFSLETDTKLAGSVQYINLYNQNSPYHMERWALISVADRGSVLSPLSFLTQMLTISTLISLAACVIVVILSSHQVVKPIADAIKIMSSHKEYRKVIRFKPSNIYEIDRMTDAITQLQIDVRDFGSQVSQMIRIADVGLSTFMYNRIDDSVFVGQSFLASLRVDVDKEEDLIMERQEFLDSIIAEENRIVITEGLEMALNGMQEEYTKEYSVNQEDGSQIWMRLNLVNTENNSIGILQNITDVMLERKRIEFERDYDSFTGLLNRRAYYRQVEELFHNKESLQTTAFIMIDLDNLKYVNDTYGHDFGDDYIKTAATILKRFQNYGGIVSRISGDEFNICLPGYSSKEEVREIIENIRGQLLQGSCLLADGTHFKIRASVGVSWYPDDSESYEMLMKYADFAMYTIKHSTKGEIAEFNMSAYAMDSVLLTGVEEMNRIIDEYSVKYAFQSIVSARTGEIYGYEALMRVQSDIFQSPLELLRTAKTGAKLYEIERMAWTRALEDFQKQIDKGSIAEGSHIFINSISNSDLEFYDVDAIEAAHPNLLNRVVLEILESESVDEEYLERKIERMAKWNAQIALDDFGTGYNSEYALITMHPKIVKIDRSIISGCDKDISRRMIINNLVKLARTKNIVVLAEGVETEEELRTVIACNVDLLQGYYFNYPLFEPAPVSPEVTELIKTLAKQRDDQKSTN